jgi:nitrite reductase/ring-hydroxylating ferredoxin subunit
VDEALFAGVVIRKGGQVFGYVDRCPHADFPLALAPDRYLTRDNSRILCAGHGAVFRLEDGVCTGGPCAGDRLEPWPVTLDADGVVRTV